MFLGPSLLPVMWALLFVAAVALTRPTSSLQSKLEKLDPDDEDAALRQAASVANAVVPADWAPSSASAVSLIGTVSLPVYEQRQTGPPSSTNTTPPPHSLPGARVLAPCAGDATVVLSPSSSESTLSQAYAPGLNCTIVFVAAASAGGRVAVSLSALDLPYSRDCRSDWLEVWDGDVSSSSTTQSLLLGRYCGDLTTTLASTTFVATSGKPSSLTLRLTTGATGVGRGVTARYRTIAACDMSEVSATGAGGAVLAFNGTEEGGTCAWVVHNVDPFQNQALPVCEPRHLPPVRCVCRIAPPRTTCLDSAYLRELR